MSIHPILDLSSNYQRNDPESQVEKNTAYDSLRGFWVNADGSAFMRSHGVPKPMTKKEDIETGEDQKGA